MRVQGFVGSSAAAGEVIVVVHVVGQKRLAPPSLRGIPVMPAASGAEAAGERAPRSRSGRTAASVSALHVGGITHFVAKGRFAKRLVLNAQASCSRVPGSAEPALPLPLRTYGDVDAPGRSRRQS